MDTNYRLLRIGPALAFVRPVPINNYNKKQDCLSRVVMAKVFNVTDEKQ